MDTAFIESIGKGFGYPLAVLGIGIAALLILKKPLSALLGRTTKIGPLEVPSAHQETHVKSATDQLVEALSGPVIEKRKKMILEEMERRKIQGVDREKWLLFGVAAHVVISEFERAYSTIYGSQLSALQDLNTTAEQGRVLADLETVFYLPATSLYPKLYQGYSFQQWLNFLESFSLVMRNGNKVLITVEGREFLKYLIQSGYTLQKVF